MNKGFRTTGGIFLTLYGLFFITYIVTSVIVNGSSDLTDDTFATLIGLSIPLILLIPGIFLIFTKREVGPVIFSIVIIIPLLFMLFQLYDLIVQPASDAPGFGILFVPLVPVYLISVVLLFVLSKKEEITK